MRIDTGFNFKHPSPTHGPKGHYPYVTAGEAILAANEVPYNNEHMKIADRTRELLKLIPEGGNFTSIPKDNPLYVKGMISHVYRRLRLDEPSKTIIAAGGGGTHGYHWPEPRALTNRERARLQSFPDDMIFKGSVADVRKQIGNAVPPNGVVALAAALMPLFKGEYVKHDLEKKSAEYQTMTIKERLQLSLAI